MKTRILTAIVATGILIPVLIFSATPVFPIALTLVAVVSLYELFHCVGVKGLHISLPIYISAAFLLFWIRYAENGQSFSTVAFSIASIILLYLFAAAILSHGKFSFEALGVIFSTSLYIVAACCMLIYVRDIDKVGKFIYLLIFIGAWITDIFAYFTGMLFGKHKLIPDVSPKKTVEGSIGGTVFCSLSFVAFGVIINSAFGGDANFLVLAIGGIAIAVISQIGDLIMSVLKRHYGIKDFGKLFPGHGGMLDRFDSILAVSLGVGVMCMLSSFLGISIL